MKPKLISLGVIFLAFVAIAFVFSGQVVKRFAEQAGSSHPAQSDGCYFGKCDDSDHRFTTNGDCSPIISSDGNVTITCEANPISECIRLGVTGPCLDRSLFSSLEKAEYAFNAPQEARLEEPQTIALVIDTTGQTDFSAELMTLPGVQVEGETPISLVMEAEVVGPAFQITPSGRQRRELSELNPTRWDWEVTPTRGGQHQLEVSLYVIASEGGQSIGEEKALAERRIVTVTVSPLNQVTEFIAKVDPILAFFVAIGGAVAAVLAWFGIKSWRDVSGKEEGEDKPQKIEVTIKDASRGEEE